jgi:hypothetical protein
MHSVWPTDNTTKMEIRYSSAAATINQMRPNRGLVERWINDHVSPLNCDDIANLLGPEQAAMVLEWRDKTMAAINAKLEVRFHKAAQQIVSVYPSKVAINCKQIFSVLTFRSHRDSIFSKLPDDFKRR